MKKDLVRYIYPGSGFFPIPKPDTDPGVKKALDPGSRIQIGNTSNS